MTSRSSNLLTDFLVPGPESIKESRTLLGSTLPVLLSRVLPSAAGCKIQIVCTLSNRGK